MEGRGKGAVRMSWGGWRRRGESERGEKRVGEKRGRGGAERCFVEGVERSAVAVVAEAFCGSRSVVL